MTKTVLAIATAGIVAGAMVTIPGLSPAVEARAAGQKGDRLDLTVRMASCLQRGWPYDQASLITPGAWSGWSRPSGSDAGSGEWPSARPLDAPAAVP
jgi:hypothetical protein